MLVTDTEALVLRRSDYGESHRMILLATAGAGTLSAVARHARKSVKRFGGGLELFTLVEARLERKKEEGPWSLSRTRIRRYHEGFVRDLGRLAAGSYAIELYRMLVPVEVVEVEVFEWLARFMQRWEWRFPGPVDMVGEELSLLTLLGHAPRFDRCVTCGRPAPPRTWARFDPSAGGIVCTGCGGEGPRLGSRTRRLLFETGRSSTGWREDPELVRVATTDAAVVRRCLDGYIRILADREPRSMGSLRVAWGLD